MDWLQKKILFSTREGIFFPFFTHVKFQTESESVVKNIIIRCLNAEFFTFTKIFSFWPKSYFKALGLKHFVKFFFLIFLKIYYFPTKLDVKKEF